ncbi:MAG: ribonuclease HII [Defluviitaleaceae bacterium]|nr:ribonuclease HII [Defluviitaleaceae bacterium]
MTKNINPKTAPDTCEAVFYEKNLGPVAGVDEAGRGPLAGPVVACALILPPGTIIPGVNDSKKLSPLRRAALAKEIMSAAAAYAYGIVDAATIDKINIHHASLLAMTKAIKGLGIKPRVALIDGKFPPKVGIPTLHIIKGDSHSHLIAAASILAKQARDEIMHALHQAYPQYGFNRNMGYGTKVHKEAIAQHGLCLEHRLSYNSCL